MSRARLVPGSHWNAAKPLLACLVMAAALAAACGKGSPSAPSPSVQTETGTAQAEGFVQYDFAPVRSGSSTITLTWSNPLVDLDLFLTDQSCPNADRLVLGGCTILARSDAASGTSERIERTVATSDRFKVWIINFSNVSQAFTITFEIR
jgi:hypothetical protein